jgi:hypothetical protein
MVLPVASKIDFDFHGPCESNASNEHHVTHKEVLYLLRIVRELPSPLNVRKLSLHVRRMTRVEIDTDR